MGVDVQPHAHSPQERSSGTFTFYEALCIEVLKGGSRRGRLPEMRARLAKELVEGFGLTMAEKARQLGVTTSGISRILEKNKLESSLSR
jgi:hypothetical protein